MTPHMTRHMTGQLISKIIRPQKTVLFNTIIAIVMVSGSLLMAVPNAWSAGDYSSTSSSESALLKAAKKDITSENFQAAYDRLSKGIASDPENADLHNLLGFSARKIGLYDISERHYTKALSIDPKHKQALEYMGELYLTLGQVDKAKDLRDRLDKICWLGCSELDDLEKAIKDWTSKNQS